MLNLTYDASIPARLLAEMERAARALGLPLAAVEDLGRDRARCEAFVQAARAHAFRAMRELAARPRGARAVHAAAAA
ncbi:MAG TPA: hypothetical protein VGR28_05430 [Candidatus Thermoplasmatota archaeon]|nr:hypothetical protein [Candidatus Thermoplasmatota archaeon]